VKYEVAVSEISQRHARLRIRLVGVSIDPATKGGRSGAFAPLPPPPTKMHLVGAGVRLRC
jgi:hypothetical protein